MERLQIRNETEKDYAIVEQITREAFWNLYVPGCEEHYLAHILRGHADFVPELDFVAELDGQVIGNVMYTKSTLTSQLGRKKQILTFGPVCIHPDFQRKGYGKALLEHSFCKALELGYDLIVILGNPGNYVGLGFKSCKKYNICMEGGVYPSAMLAKELKPDALSVEEGPWTYSDSPDYHSVHSAEAERFDQQFAPKEKRYQASQEEFYIHSHSFIQ